MRLLPLGRLAGMPADGQASSGYLVETGSARILLDAGPGTAVQLSRHLDDGLDAVFVSHLHTDHVLDVLPIGKMLLRRGERLPLFVPAGARAVLDRYAALFPVVTHPDLDRAFDLAFEVIEYRPGEVHHVGAATLRTALLRHAAPNCGIRVEAGGRSLVYTGDTGVTPALPELARGADVLLAECTLRETDTSGHGHLSSRDAAEAARDAGAGALVLTHFAGPDPAEHEWHRRRAAEVFAGPVTIATVDQREVL
ncbi:MBL fold metallo-hydrolase [Dactylosporangium sp. AC04546]|uniref:MBL fold metallo-hydrolase n=1 Tax=Dactylosporangium sp. AC04546 TaxID=2862460 RepID=UPI001EDF4A97|nr:MBL fold metallo-hydrolase [Dactylosporangium sp. AC04546]WVK79095.1 MBL fold metallo-hydrolase [Dactylosporangium sp. AC04546]